jgi:hypothetical protein
MRVRDHFALTTAGAAALGRRLHGGAFGLWAGGVLLDVDHYVWFCARHRTWDPVAAVRYFNAANVPQDPATRLLHSRAALVLILLLGTRRKRALPIALGMGAHVALDAYHELRMSAAREEALRRDEFACQACGTRAADVGTHLLQQPWLLPSYEPQNLVSLCAACHRLAHANGSASWN